MKNERQSINLNGKVFFPPIIILILTIGYSLYDNENYMKLTNGFNRWILETLGGVFSWSAFLFLIILIAVYFSPLGKVTIGGKDAEPILTKWRWFAIALCTTIATGILFWGMAEPLHHFEAPPKGLDATAQSSEALQFSMSTMFMHWSFTPYAIYTVTALMFALTYYNLKQPFRISSLVYPLFGKKVHGGLGVGLDVMCLYALVAGMSASLGAGIFALMGGLDIVLNIPNSTLLMGLIGFAIVVAFIISAASGLKRGIRILSDFNIKAFLALATFVFIFGPTREILQMSWSGLIDYVVHLVPRSTNVGSSIDIEWQYSWTIFYWANWFAWAPIAALFLGRLAVGYTVRQLIHFNLIFPSLFAILWMMIFSGTALHFDMVSDGTLYKMMVAEGEENVMYEVFNQLPFGKVISLCALVMVFISYVTAADSNISAMSAMSTVGISPENPEAPLIIKVVWGILIGTITWVMISSAGIDGIRILSILGGFPALFIIILVAVGVVKLIWNTNLVKEEN